jgi:hypothetical protein
MFMIVVSGWPIITIKLGGPVPNQLRRMNSQEIGSVDSGKLIARCRERPVLDYQKKTIRSE